MTTVFTNALAAGDSGLAISHRIVVAITGGAEDQVRVTFKAAATDSLAPNHCSIGISLSSAATTATPVELLFSGGSGFSITSGQTKVSDWVNLNGFTSTNKLVVVIDDADASDTARYADLTGAHWYYNDTTQTYNSAAPSGMNDQADLAAFVTLIETQTAAGGATNVWKRTPNFTGGFDKKMTGGFDG